MGSEAGDSGMSATSGGDASTIVTVAAAVVESGGGDPRTTPTVWSVEVGEGWESEGAASPRTEAGSGMGGRATDEGAVMGARVGGVSSSMGTGALGSNGGDGGRRRVGRVTGGGEDGTGEAARPIRRVERRVDG